MEKDLNKWKNIPCPWTGGYDDTGKDVTSPRIDLHIHCNYFKNPSKIFPKQAYSKVFLGKHRT